MNPNRKTIAAALIEAIAWTLLVWYSLPAHARHELHARAWHQLARGLRASAHTIGRAAIAAEAHYWEVVRP